MDASTLRLHKALIRLAKGMVSAWEEWVTCREATHQPYRAPPQAKG